MALRDDSLIDADSAYVDQRDNGKIDYNERDGIHQRGYSSHKLLRVGKRLIAFDEAGGFFLLLAECADNPHAREILTCGEQNAVHLFLNLAVQRNAYQHDPEHNNGEKRYCHNECQRRLGVHRERHYHSAEHHKRRTQKQAEGHIHPVLHLIHVACHACDESRGSERINVRIRKALNVFKERVANSFRKTDCGLGGEILCSNGAYQSHHAERQQQQAHFHGIAPVSAADASVDNCSHHQRNKQFKRSLQQLEERTQNALHFEIP